MGNNGSSNEAETRVAVVAPVPFEDYPYLYAIRDPSALDWKADLTNEEITKHSKLQCNLPVPIGSPETGI